MGQRVRKTRRGQRPSSARQLPILAALDARSPTLFPSIIYDNTKNVNSYFVFSIIFYLITMHLFATKGRICYFS